MSSSLVLTVIGADQPGLVEALSRTVAEHGGNWQRSRMARLGGSFAGILEVRVTEDASAGLYKALHELEARGLRVTVTESDADVDASPYRTLQLELVGQDRPGIIRDISHALASAGVNVAELSTDTSPAPMSGETLFRARAELHHPLARSLDELRATLEKIAGNLMVDIALDEAKG
jgi:glycine cleavage system regulatory protein